MTKMKKAFKIARTLPLDVVAGQISEDITAALYNSVGNKIIADLREGDALEDVVAQGLDRTGMSDTLMRLSSTRIEVKVGIDVSGSMFNRSSGSPIVRATSVTRLLRNAFARVSGAFPPNVFRSSIWLWAVGWSGAQVICLDSPYYHDNYSTLHSYDLTDALKDTDAFLERLSKRSRWAHAGGSTRLSHLLKQWAVWEANEGNETAHKLDIVVTDGQIYDTTTCSDIQNKRDNNKSKALFLNISGWVGDVPVGFTGYRIGILDLESTIKDELISFVSQIY